MHPTISVLEKHKSKIFVVVEACFGLNKAVRKTKTPTVSEWELAS